MPKAGKGSSGSLRKKQALSNTASELRPKAAVQKTNNSGSISGRMRERKPRSHVQKIASILTKKRTGEASELRNDSELEDKQYPSNSSKTNSNFVAGKLVKRTLQKASKLNLIKNDTQKRTSKSSALRSYAAQKSERPQQRKNRRPKWKGDTKNMKKVKSVGTSNMDGFKRKQQRRKKKKKAQNVPQDEVSRAKRRIKYLLLKMKLEQNLIDAYSGEGWKGQSREKIRPEKELERAERQILQCKLGIREAVHQLDLLSSEGSIADAVIDPEGRVFHEHIFCAKCKLTDALPDNDIILCDGACNRGFHQKCLDPPLATENIPPGDQGWLCKVCECKLESLEAINAHLGTQFTVDNGWEEIFAEAASIANGENTATGNGEEWPSDDSEDDDYDPEKQENINETGNENNMSDSGKSSGWSESSNETDNESDASLTDNLNGYISKGRKRSRDTDEKNGQEPVISLDSDENDGSDMPVSGRRQRRDVDYKKLHDEMFGKGGSCEDEVSEDEDWGPSRRRRRGKQPDANTTKDSSIEEKEHSRKEADEKVAECSQSSIKDKKHIVRLPANAVEKLRKVFAETELPSRSYKENLSQQLGLTFRKVHMWFKNARYMSLKSRKEMPGNEKSNESNLMGEGGVGQKKKIPKEKKAESASLISSVRVENKSRNTKRKHRRKNMKTPLSISSRNESKRTMSRLPANAVERFRQVFAENELPSMSCKMVLSKQLDLPYRQVHMWFKNARYMSLKKKKMNRLKESVAPVISANTRRLKVESSKSTPQIKESVDAGNSYLTEMEKLGNIELKLESLRKILETVCPKEGTDFSNDKNREGIANLLSEDLLMYVPVVELREKSLQVAPVR